MPHSVPSRSPTRPLTPRGVASGSSRNKEIRVAIVGAGMSGLLAGVKLRQKGYSAFSIYEKASDVGGTWRDNRYPGLACDVPAHA